MSNARLLVLMNEDQCPPAFFQPWIEEVGVELDVRHPYADERLPAVGEHHGVIVLGGEMGANDDDTCPWLAPVRDFIRDAVEADVPYLGICLGHQLAARALGGRVTRNPHGTTVGLVPVGLTDAGDDDPLLHGVRGHLAVQWNLDVVRELPPHAVQIAAAPDGTVQAARYAERAWGVQFHPEAGPDQVAVWSSGKDSRTDPPSQVVDRLIDDVDANVDVLRGSWQVLAQRFAAQVLERAGQPTPS